MSWKYKYDQLKKWIEGKGYSIVEGSRVEDSIVYEDLKIFINTLSRIEYRFYTLLHECGHYLLFENSKVFLETYPIFPSNVEDGRVERSVKYKVCLIAEELKAWEKGWRLAHQLNLPVDQKKYHHCMVDALWTYIADAAKPKTTIE